VPQKPGSFKQHWVNKQLVYSIQTPGIPSAHSAKLKPEENIMQNAMLALILVSLLATPAFAGSLNAGDKPIVVAENVNVRVGGIGVGVGERHRHRDHSGLYMSARGHHAFHNDRDHH
jgi:hypothetical protein